MLIVEAFGTSQYQDSRAAGAGAAVAGLASLGGKVLRLRHVTQLRLAMIKTTIKM